MFDKKRKYYVYAWCIKGTDEVFYIGKGTGNRYRTRKRENSYFMKMVDSHDCYPKIIHDNLTEEEAFELEKQEIAHYRSIEGNRLTNILDGGDNPPLVFGPKSEEQKKKMRESMKRFYNNHPEASRESSRRLKEFLKTEEGKRFFEKSIKARKTPEFKKAQKERVNRFCRTEEYRKKVSDALYKHFRENGPSEAMLGANNHNAQSVAQLDLDGNLLNEYKSLTEASKATGISVSKISAVCKGRRKTAGGYIWKYLNDKHITLHRENKYDVESDKCAKAVEQYTLDGKFVREYRSVAEATRENGFPNRTNISVNLSGRTKSAYGFVWKYKQGNTVPSIER